MVGYLPGVGVVLGLILSTAKRGQCILWVEIACCVASPWSFLGPTCFLSLGHVFGGLSLGAAFLRRYCLTGRVHSTCSCATCIPTGLPTATHTHTRSRSPRLPHLDALGCSPTHALFDNRMTWRLPGFQTRLLELHVSSTWQTVSCHQSAVLMEGPGHELTLYSEKKVGSCQKKWIFTLLL